MNINELIDRIIEEIAIDPATRQFCESNYARAHKVYVNLDDRNWPSDEDTPYLAIFPDSKSVGHTQSNKGHVLECLCCIYDDTGRQHPWIDNIFQYQGVYRVEEFRKHTETAITKADLVGGVIESIDVDYDVISSFPFHFASMIISISEPVTIGSDYLL